MAKRGKGLPLETAQLIAVRRGRRQYATGQPLALAGGASEGRVPALPADREALSFCRLGPSEWHRWARDGWLRAASEHNQ